MFLRLHYLFKKCISVSCLMPLNPRWSLSGTTMTFKSQSWDTDWSSRKLKKSIWKLVSTCLCQFWLKLWQCQYLYFISTTQSLNQTDWHTQRNHLESSQKWRCCEWVAPVEMEVRCDMASDSLLCSKWMFFVLKDHFSSETQI